MKKIIAFMCLIMMCFSFCACDPGTYQISSDSLKNVTSIELIDYKNPDQKHFSSWVPDHFDNLVAFDNSNVTVIEELKEEKVSEFLETFAQTDILHTYYAYNSPKDVCIRINYSNGNFLIIWADYKNNSFSGYIGEYLSNGSVLSFWGSFSALMYYQNLVNDFFTYNI